MFASRGRYTDVINTVLPFLRFKEIFNVNFNEGRYWFSECLSAACNSTSPVSLNQQMHVHYGGEPKQFWFKQEWLSPYTICPYKRLWSLCVPVFLLPMVPKYNQHRFLSSTRTFIMFFRGPDLFQKLNGVW